MLKRYARNKTSPLPSPKGEEDEQLEFTAFSFVNQRSLTVYPQKRKTKKTPSKVFISSKWLCFKDTNLKASFH
jgi:hypothetical protein